MLLAKGNNQKFKNAKRWGDVAMMTLNVETLNYERKISSTSKKRLSPLVNRKRTAVPETS